MPSKKPSRGRAAERSIDHCSQATNLSYKVESIQKEIKNIQEDLKAIKAHLGYIKPL